MHLKVQERWKEGLRRGNTLYEMGNQSNNLNEKLHYWEQAGLYYHLPALNAIVDFHKKENMILEQYFWSIMGTFILDGNAIDLLQGIEDNHSQLLNDNHLKGMYIQHVVAFFIGNHYQEQKDIISAIKWYELAERFGDTDCFYRLSQLYAMDHPKKDLQKSQYYLKKYSEAKQDK